MSTLLIAVAAGVGFLVAYYTYGRWLSRKIFGLRPDAPVPSIELNDDKDYVPTAKSVVFGHHFTSIAGTGPIVGPAIAVIWGWLPALLWVIFGSIFIGAVHDIGALVVSLRNRGHTVGDIAGRVLNPRARLLFLLILLMALTIVLAIFGLVIAAVFRQYPEAIFPCVFQVPLAIAIGVWLHRKGVNLLVPSAIALGLMYLSVIFGNVGWLGALNGWMATWPTIVWVAVLLAYSYVASVLPVWTLLQPRDYINSLQLLTALALVLVGLVVTASFGGAPPSEGAARPALEIAAPMINFSPQGAPLLIPFLFVTVACGAISGFHCLVSSGTSSKQLKCETDARFVGYGGMLMEGFLATLVILACVAGLGLGIPGGEGGATLMGEAAYQARYESWSAAGALSAKVAAFVDGAANFLRSMAIPASVATALMGVLVASFAATTLDTATRLQRYVVQELAGLLRSPGGERGAVPIAQKPVALLSDRHGATIFAVLIAGFIAAFPAPGQPWTLATAGSGGLILWPLFGATNQLLAGLAFLVVSFYLWRRSVTVSFIVLPMLFMLLVPGVALAMQVPQWLASDSPNWVIIFIGIATLALEAWMIVEAVLLWPRVRGVLEEGLPPLRAEPEAAPAMAGAADPQADGGRSC